MPELFSGNHLAAPPEAPQMAGTPPVLRMALVNSMADAALAMTEQRFARLLRAAFPEATVELRCVTPPQIARGEMAAARVARHYVSPKALFDEPPDVIVFSGAEPRAENLRGEDFWPFLADLFDWTREARIAALFSCLAAHAAVLHFSEIRRVRLPRKAFGFFTQFPVAEHPLLAGLPKNFSVAHSRWNALHSAELAAGGYTVLTQGRGGEVDMFVPANGAPMLFLQGHPEYEPTALEGEYRRDLRRFLAGETTLRPELPAHDQAGAWAPGDPQARAPGLGDFVPVLRNFIALKKEMAA